MAMQKMSGGEQHPAWNDANKNKDFVKGATLNGFYVEKQVNIGPKNSNLYVILKEDDTKVALWGSTVIDGAFENIKLGAEVEIEFTGKEKTKSGNDVNTYEISADNEHPNVANFS